MKVGDKVKLNIDRILENYTLSLMTSNNPQDYRFIIWAKKNKDEIFTIKTVLYGSLIRIDGYDRVFTGEELRKV